MMRASNTTFLVFCLSLPLFDSTSSSSSSSSTTSTVSPITTSFVRSNTIKSEKPILPSSINNDPRYHEFDEPQPLMTTTHSYTSTKRITKKKGKRGKGKRKGGKQYTYDPYSYRNGKGKGKRKRSYAAYYYYYYDHDDWNQHGHYDDRYRYHGKGKAKKSRANDKGYHDHGGYLGKGKGKGHSYGGGYHGKGKKYHYGGGGDYGKGKGYHNGGGYHGKGKRGKKSKGYHYGYDYVVWHYGQEGGYYYPDCQHHSGKGKGKGYHYVDNYYNHNHYYQHYDDWWYSEKGKGKGKRTSSQYKQRKLRHHNDHWYPQYYQDSSHYYYYYYNNHYNYNYHNNWYYGHKCREPSTSLPTHKHTDAPTPTPFYYVTPGGGISCYNPAAGGSTHEGEDMAKTTVLTYEYKLVTLAGYDANDVVENVEGTLAEMFQDRASEILDCDSDRKGGGAGGGGIFGDSGGGSGGASSGNDQGVVVGAGAGYTDEDKTYGSGGASSGSDQGVVVGAGAGYTDEDNTYGSGGGGAGGGGFAGHAGGQDESHGGASGGVAGGYNGGSNYNDAGNGDESVTGLLGIDPKPVDEVSSKNEECDSCFDIGGQVTIFTGEDTSNDDVCKLLGMIESHAVTADVEGVQSIEMKNAYADGISCGSSPNIEGFSAATTIEVEEEGNFHGMFWPVLVALLALLLLLILFVRRKRQKYLRDLVEIEERTAGYIADINSEKDFYPLNAIDVHQCNSAQCRACGRHENNGDTQFVNTDGAKLVRNVDGGWSMKNSEVIDQYPNDEASSLDMGNQQQTNEI